MYKKCVFENQVQIVKDDKLFVPMDEANRDYQDFLEYLDENNLTINDIPEWEG